MGDNRSGWVVVAGLLALAACGGSSNPAAPSSPEGGGTNSTQTCRNAATSTTSVNASAGFTATVAQTCSINAASSQGQYFNWRIRDQYPFRELD
jgi:hypothetical protein